jgi:hypothetical protein
MGPSAPTAKWQSVCYICTQYSKMFQRHGFNETFRSCTQFTVRTTVTRADLLDVLHIHCNVKSSLAQVYEEEMSCAVPLICVFNVPVLIFHLLKFSHNTFLYQSIFCTDSNTNNAKYTLNHNLPYTSASTSISEWQICPWNDANGPYYGPAVSLLSELTPLLPFLLVHSVPISASFSYIFRHSPWSW